ncbi:MAG: dTDP-4-dehydrorhamnose reductase [Gemmatimonadota bacterium]|nr:dTDP-4-dehydrorhamnose reductase [Gemmatimonadota bacterium]
MRSVTRVFVTGAEGLLGREVVAVATRRGYTVEAAGRGDLDATDADAVRACLVGRGRGEGPELVVHCAAYTAVDRAEEEPELAARVNRDGTAHVARAAAEAGARLIYPSTDYVFDGERATPYPPDTPPAPRSVYGRSKLEGERVALASAPEALVVRTSWLYGAGGRNFVTAMLERGRARAREAGAEELRVVDDQRGRPTWARNTAEGMLDLFERRARGVWHVADGGEATWLDLAREAFRLCGVDAPIGPVSTAEWGAPAPRPAYSVLDVAGTEALLGRKRMNWREALRRFLTETGELT